MSPPRIDPHPTPDNLRPIGRKASTRDAARDQRPETDEIRRERLDHVVGLTREHVAAIVRIDENADKARAAAMLAASEASRACAIATRGESIAQKALDSVLRVESNGRDMADAVGALQAFVVNQQVDEAKKAKTIANHTAAAGGAVATLIYVALKVAELFLGG